MSLACVEPNNENKESSHEMMEQSDIMKRYNILKRDMLSQRELMLQYQKSGKRNQMTGSEFNELFSSLLFIKVMDANESYIQRYEDGLNVKDTSAPAFKAIDDCFHFAEINDLATHMDTYQAEIKLEYVKYVHVHDDAQVYFKQFAIVADKIYLSEKTKISDLEDWHDEEFCMRSVKLNPHVLKFIGSQSEKLCIEAVRKNAKALAHVNNKTIDIRNAAIPTINDSICCFCSTFRSD